MNNKILIMDDEPHFLEWLVEYIESKGFGIDIVNTVDQAVAALDNNSYRVVICDLNVPASFEMQSKIDVKGNLYKKYRGLYPAEYARTKGHRGKQVIVYSVHDSEDVQEKCRKVDIQYLVKARPREFKKEFDNILSYSPN
ncbi:response regulator [Cronobacter malonaticus]|uniref:response regulator n=1 Tax=Cronobacter malonaticus TaxID=413503 RepID=UPI000517CBD7|nr:response regulator [Cronobacter sakazakii]